MKDKTPYIILTLAALFVVIYAYGNFLPPYWLLPDETANIFFSKLYANSYDVTYQEPLNALTLGGVTVRHAINVNITVLPYTFIGVPTTHGLFLRLIPDSLFFINALFGVLLVLFAYLIARETFGQEYATGCAIVLFFTAPLWYFSSLMYNNMAASSLFTAGSYFLLKTLKDDKWKHYIMMGLFFGAANLMRYMEVIFLSIPLGIVLLTSPSLWKKIPRFAVAGVVFTAVFLPVFIFNAKHIGSAFSVGYMPDEISSPTVLLERIKYYLLPASIIPEILFETTSKYLFNFFFPMSILALIGLFIMLHSYKKQVQQHKKFLLFILLVLICITLYYGSGEFHGLNVQKPVIHASYVRYWLLSYVAMTMLTCFILAAIKRPYLKAIVLSALIILNLNIILGSDALQSTFLSTYRYEKMTEQLENRTEPNALIFTDYWGKWMRSRKTATRLPNGEPEDLQIDAQMICNLVKKNLPVYIIPGKTMANPKDLQPYAEQECGVSFKKDGELYKAVNMQ